MNKVIIHWRSEITGETGHGMPIDREIAEEWIEQMRGKYPHIVHWIEDETKESEPAQQQ